MNPNVKRGQHLGGRVHDEPEEESEHFMLCTTCGGYFDRRDLGQLGQHWDNTHTRPVQQ